MPNPKLLKRRETGVVIPVIAGAISSHLYHIIDSVMDQNGVAKTRCGRRLHLWSRFPYGVISLEHAAQHQHLCPRCGDLDAFSAVLKDMLLALSAYHAEMDRKEAALYKARSDALCALAEDLIEQGFDVEVTAGDTARTFTITHEGSTFGVIVKKAAGQPDKPQKNL